MTLVWHAARELGLTSPPRAIWLNTHRLSILYALHVSGSTDPEEELLIEQH